MILKNTTCLILHPARVEYADLRVQDGVIVSRGRNLSPRKGEETVDLSGRYVMPGLVNTHMHLYSVLARGMKGPARPPRTFLDVLKSIWWRLDTALDDESVYYSALVGSIEAAKCGTTLIVDHHASPGHIRGSLDLIKKAMTAVGLRGILCYETTDRGGTGKRDQGLEENERFITENANNPHFRGTMGAHASFTLNDDTLGTLGDLSGMYDCGVHLHVAEDRADVADAARRRADIIGRLQKKGILSGKSILAHGVHLTGRQVAVINRTGSWLVHNPRSNMNNAVGYAPVDRFGPHSALGTDGFPSDMFEESSAGFFRNRESAHRVAITRWPEMLHGGQLLASKFWGSDFGTLRAGSPADLIVLDYPPPTPLVSGNVAGHFLFGMKSGMVKHVMVDGRWILFNGRMTEVDEEKIMAEASAAAGALWRRWERNGK